MKLILFGPPGSGKGTQAQLIMKKYNIPQISTGDIIRDNIKRKTDIGRKAKEIIESGKLLDDRIVVALVKERLKSDDCKKGYILDGFPRTLAQAKALDEFSTIDKVVLLEVPDKEVIKRISGRRMCRCGATYHVIFKQPRHQGICDNCSDHLYIREDDKEETIKERLRIYRDQTKPLAEFYGKQDKVIRFDGTKSIDGIFKEISTALDREMG